MDMSGYAATFARRRRWVKLSTAGTLPLSWIVALLAISTLCVAMMMAWAGLTINFLKPSNLAPVFLLVTLAIIRKTTYNSNVKRYQIIGDFAEYFALFAFISLLGATATYPAAAATRGFVDPLLHRMDEFLHFNWLFWYQLVVEYPLLQSLGRLSYASIYLSPAILLATFAISGERARAQFFILSFWLAAVITMLLFLALPAVGPLAYLWQGPPPYLPTSALYQAQLLPLLRDGMFNEVDLGALQGLVCAPSFHTTIAIIYIYMAWQNRYIRWPLLAINVAMLLSTPIEGTHYLTDMIGGVAVALFALATVTYLRNLFTSNYQNRWYARQN